MNKKHETSKRIKPQMDNVTEKLEILKIEKQDCTLRNLCGEPAAIPVKEKSKMTKKKSAYEKLPKLSIRFDRMDHVPNFDHNEKRNGFKCKLKGCGKQTTVYCEKCKVHLCFCPGLRGRNCFKNFHILENN